MAAPTGHDWYLREWFATAELIQHDLIKKLDYHPNQAHRLWHGLQPYRRENVEQIAALLNIKPYELLMHPEEAMKLRRLQTVIAEAAKPDADAAPTTPQIIARTGTDG